LSLEFRVDFESTMLNLFESESERVGDRGQQINLKTALKVVKELGTKVVIPAILSVTEEIPLIDRISRLLSKFGGLLQEMNDQDSLVDGLRSEIAKAKESIQICEEISPFDRADLNTSLPMLELEESLEAALGALAELSSQGTLLGVAFCKKDNEAMKEHISKLSQSLQLLFQSVPLYQQRVTHRQKMRGLLHYPEVFHATIRDHLARFQPGSRQWLFEEVEQWLDTTVDSSPLGCPLNRVFWVRADPGMGKSAFAASLSKKLKADGRFLGAYFCRYTVSNESASKIIRSWAAQCCESLSAQSSSSCAKDFFERAFLEWDTVPDDEKPSSSELFELLLTRPLCGYTDQIASLRQGSIPDRAFHPSMVLLIDALDEVLPGERKPLLQILSSKMHTLPKWVKFIVTSRPEADIVHSFASLDPVEIMEDDPRHLEDIRLFVEFRLREAMEEEELNSGVDLFVERSEGRFIYVSSIIEEILRNRMSRWSLADLDDNLPEGLIGWYREFFVRMKARDTKYFEEVIFRVVKIIICAKEPLTLAEARSILELHLSPSQEQRLLDNLRQLFPLRTITNSSSSESGVFVPFHKSVYDWLRNEDASGSYSHGEERDDFYISVGGGNQLFVDHFRTLFVSKWLDEGDLSCCPTPGSYFYRHAFDHFRESDSPDDAAFGADQLFRLRVLVSLLEERGVHEIIRIVSAPSWTSFFPLVGSELTLLGQLLQLSAPAFDLRASDALPFQILARLTPSQSDDPNHRLKRLRNECLGWQSITEIGYWLRPLRNYLIPAGGPLKNIIKLHEVALHTHGTLFDPCS
jgi:hypothetical protein